ncbi:MAG TPA: hypothetical protein VK559_08965 [Ferruginibacter sp.]|nr:hypothetical protein [Ferruginibacter sp.]
MKLPIPILGLFIGCIIIASCTKEKTNTVTVIKVDTINHTDTANAIDTITHTTFAFPVNDSTVQLSADSISESIDGTPDLFTYFSTMDLRTIIGWNGDPAKPFHIFAMQAQDDANNAAANYLYITINTTDNYLIANKTYGTIGDSTSTVTFTLNDASFGSSFGSEFSGKYSQGPSIATIKSISSNEITGTFQGTLFANNDSTGSNKKMLTNGKFNVLY